MTDEQVRRYARHILLPDVGGRGQERLLASRCVVEVGPEREAERIAVLYLAAAGVGTIGLAGPSDAALAGRVAAINPDVRVVPASELGADAPRLAVPDAAWLADAPPAAVAFARGGAAACALLARLVRP